MFFFRISHSMLFSNQDTPVMMNSTGASSFPNYAICSKLSTCSSCIEAEVIFNSAPAFFLKQISFRQLNREKYNF